MLSRILSWLLLPLAAWLAWRWFRALRDGAARQQRAARPAPGATLVACAHCGLRLPRPEAIAEDDAYFCCAEHRDAYRQRD